jgi:hypothetical protein
MASLALSEHHAFHPDSSPGCCLPEEGALINQRFRLGPVLGEGGMSTVHRARDERMFLHLRSFHEQVFIQFP